MKRLMSLFMRLFSTKDNVSLALLGFFFCKEQLLYFFNTLGLFVLRTNTTYDVIPVYFVYYLCIIWFLYYTFRRCNLKTIWLLIGSGFFVGITMLIFRDNVRYIVEYGQRIFLNFIFPIIVLQQIDDKSRINSSIRLGTLIAGATMLIAYPMNELVLGNHTAIDGYMVLTYMILVGFAGYMYFGITEKNTIYIAIATVLFLEMVMAGSRGPLFCGAVITAIALIRSYAHINSRSLIAIVITILSIFGLIYFLDDMLLLLQRMTIQHGINARVLELIASGKFLNNESTEIRNDVFVYLKDCIKDNPIGYGFLGDRVVLAKINASYPHNFFYEILLQFGWFLGGGISIYVIYVLLHQLLARKYKSIFEPAIDITLAVGFVKLMFSGSYVWEPYFAIMIYLILTGIRMGLRKQRRILYG